MILVTGAAGFIGSHLVERLLADGHEVIGADNFDPFYPRANKEANLAPSRTHPGFRFVEVDVREADALQRALAAFPSISVIIHLAARAGVRPSLEDPAGYTQVNVGGTLNLLEYARRHQVAQFVLASSSSVYGVNPRVPWREDDHDLQPISPYASSKLSAEMLGHVYAHTYGLRVVALRFFTVFGPRQRPDLAIAKFVRLIRAGKTIPVYGDGSTRRDYTFVADTVAGIMRALGYQGSRFEIINLGNHRTVTLTDLIAAIGRTFEIEPRLQNLPDQPGDVPQTWADISKAQQLLGWEPRTTIAAGLQAYRNWLDQTAGARA